MIHRQLPESPEIDLRNSPLVLLAFISVIAFQLTVIKSIWHIELLARIINTVILIWASVYFIYSIFFNKFNKNIWLYFLLPGVLVFFGYFVNLAYNITLNLNLLNQLGLLLPWVVYLTVPQLMKSKILNSENLWRYYYNFMIVVLMLGVVEHFLLLSDLIGSNKIVTAGGPFEANWFSIHFAVDDGSVYDRFYSCFPEPGTLAMYIIPALSYAFFRRKYFGLFLLGGALYLTQSLGGYISLGILIAIALYLQIRLWRVNLYVAFAILFCGVSFLYVTFSNDLVVAYEQKGNSRLVRESSTLNFLYELPNLLVNNPRGSELTEDSESRNLNQHYFGSNFALGNAFMVGGILSLIGYVAILLVSIGCSIKVLLRRSIPIEERIAFSSIISILPFLFQRSVVWDSAIFAFLFAPSIIRLLQSRRIFGSA